MKAATSSYLFFAILSYISVSQIFVSIKNYTDLSIPDDQVSVYEGMQTTFMFSLKHTEAAWPRFNHATQPVSHILSLLLPEN